MTEIVNIPTVQVAIGTEVEMEHSDNPEDAKKIAMDHLKEDPEYYMKLYRAGLIDEPKATDLIKKINKEQ